MQRIAPGIWYSRLEGGPNKSAPIRGLVSDLLESPKPSAARSLKQAGKRENMAARPKTRQMKALIKRTLSEDALLEMVATGWTLQKIGDHIESLTGKPCSKYYVCKALQACGQRYTAAKQAQAQLQAERVADIADRVESGQLDPASARVASENRRWVASKLDPQTYGERQALDIRVADVTEMHLQALKQRMQTIDARIVDAGDRTQSASE